MRYRQTPPDAPDINKMYVGMYRHIFNRRPGCKTRESVVRFRPSGSGFRSRGLLRMRSDNFFRRMA